MIGTLLLTSLFILATVIVKDIVVNYPLAKQYYNYIQWELLITLYKDLDIDHPKLQIFFYARENVYIKIGKNKISIYFKYLLYYICSNNCNMRYPRLYSCATNHFYRHSKGAVGSNIVPDYNEYLSKLSNIRNLIGSM